MTRHSSRHLALLVGLSYLAGAGYAVRLALDPRAYYVPSPADRTAWAAPWPAVAFVCLLMLGEAAVVLAALDGRAGRPLWRRAALGAAALSVWAVPSTLLGFLHAPGYLTWHALWVWGLLAVLLAATTGSLAAAAIRRFAGGRPVGRRPARRAA